MEAKEYKKDLRFFPQVSWWRWESKSFSGLFYEGSCNQSSQLHIGWVEWRRRMSSKEKRWKGKNSQERIRVGKRKWQWWQQQWQDWRKGWKCRLFRFWKGQWQSAYWHTKTWLKLHWICSIFVIFSLERYFHKVLQRPCIWQKENKDNHVLIRTIKRLLWMIVFEMSYLEWKTGLWKIKKINLKINLKIKEWWCSTWNMRMCKSVMLHSMLKKK